MDGAGEGDGTVTGDNILPLEGLVSDRTPLTEYSTKLVFLLKKGDRETSSEYSPDCVVCFILLLTNSYISSADMKIDSLMITDIFRIARPFALITVVLVFTTAAVTAALSVTAATVAVAAVTAAIGRFRTLDSLKNLLETDPLFATETATNITFNSLTEIPAILDEMTRQKSVLAAWLLMLLSVSMRVGALEISNITVNVAIVSNVLVGDDVGEGSGGTVG